jgi:hypothetical protein
MMAENVTKPPFGMFWVQANVASSQVFGSQMHSFIWYHFSPLSSMPVLFSEMRLTQM